MGSYVKSNLLHGEKICHEGRTSIISLLPKIMTGVILIPLFGLGIVLIISAAIEYYTTELAITNKRVIAKFGLIRRDTIEINLSKVESIQVTQGILGRIFDFGSIVISGAGDPQGEIMNVL